MHRHGRRADRKDFPALLEWDTLSFWKTHPKKLLHFSAVCAPSEVSEQDAPHPELGRTWAVFSALGQF